MTAIPNELTININTSIPGFQKIKFKPSMLIKDISKDDSTVRFDPLIKYNQSEINEIPENLRTKEFFNKGLFYSLVNHLNQKQIKIAATKEGIKEATRKGYIDNNIRITLNNIFKEGSVIDIGGQSYVIADVQWSSGDWKISTKKVEELDSSRITNPYLKQVVVKDEIISGEKQLQELPPEVVYGNNFTGQKNVVASGVKNITTTPTLGADADADAAKKAAVEDAAKKKAIDEAAKKKAAAEAASPTGTLDPITEPAPIFIKSNKSTYSLIYYFKKNEYYNLFNSVFRDCDDNTKVILQNALSNSVSTKMVMNAQNISKTGYLESVDGLSVVQNTGGGDCFFIAVADAINYYNFYNQNKRIIYNIYGTGRNLFTQKVIRTIVANYVANWSSIDDFLTNVAPVNVADLNKAFSDEINAIKLALRNSGKSDYISPASYIQIANSVYVNGDNFLVKMPTNVPIDIASYESPFKALLKHEVTGYINSSSYWANDITITALCITLKLNVIPIGRKTVVGPRSILNIPYANFSITNDDWNKYMFLYYNQNHYELMTFNKKNGNKITIFERNHLTCPLYLLFLIFGSYYAPIIDADDKNNFTFYRDIMIAFENSLNSPNNSNAKFYNLFMSYFPDNKINSLPPTSATAATATSISPPSIAPTAAAAASTKNLSKPTQLKEFFKKQNALKAAATSGTSAIPPPTSTSTSPATYYTREELKNPAIIAKLNAIKAAGIAKNPATASIPPPPAYKPLPPPPPVPLPLATTSAVPLKSSLKKVRFNVPSGGAPPNNQYYRPMPYGQPPYGYRKPYYYNPNYKLTVIDDNKTNLSYIIDLYMELHPGTTMSEEERKGLKCNSKWNAIRKSYADFVGKPYVIPPLYKKYNNKTLKVSNNPNINNPNINKNNITRKQMQ
jgi:hypothetical protein